MSAPAPGTRWLGVPPWHRAVLPSLVVVGVAGCVTIEATLDANGSGTLQMVYRTPPDATEFLEKRRFSSHHVTVESVKIKEDGTTTLKARVDDAIRLSTAAGFRDASVSLVRQNETQVLTVALVNRNPVDVKDQRKPGPQIKITLPGKVLEANEGATVSGNTVSWRFGLAEYAKRKSTELRVRFEAPPPSPTSTVPPKADAPR